MSVSGPVYRAFAAFLALAVSGVLIALETQASIILTAGNHLASGEQDILLGSGDIGPMVSGLTNTNIAFRYPQPYVIDGPQFLRIAVDCRSAG